MTFDIFFGCFSVTLGNILNFRLSSGKLRPISVEKKNRMASSDIRKLSLPMVVIHLQNTSEYVGKVISYHLQVNYTMVLPHWFVGTCNK